jgi:hypothetical protein
VHFGVFCEKSRFSSQKPLGEVAVLAWPAYRGQARNDNSDFFRRLSGADGGAEGVGEGLREALDVGVMFSFDHDAG